jgi:hypothetical protein
MSLSSDHMNVFTHAQIVKPILIGPDRLIHQFFGGKAQAELNKMLN